MSDSVLRRIERQFASAADAGLVDQYAAHLKRSRSNPSSAELANELLIAYMRRFDVPYAWNNNKGVIEHRIPIYKPVDRRGCIAVSFDDRRNGMHIINLPFNPVGSRFEEPIPVAYRAPITFGALLSVIDRFVVPDHNDVVESILPMFQVAADASGAGIKLEEHARKDSGFGFSREDTGPPHSEIFTIQYSKWPEFWSTYNTLRCNLVLRRFPFNDIFEFRINENIQFGGGWEVLDLALSGTSYQENGPGGWGVEEDEDDLDLHDYDTILGPNMMQERISYYIDEMRNGLNLF